MKRTSDNIKDPLFRCVEREVNFAANLLRAIRQDLADIQSVCDGSKKQTNDTRDLLNNLSKGITPSTWKKYRVPPRISAMQWMSDFVTRLKQLDKLATLTTNEGVRSLRVRIFFFLSTKNRSCLQLEYSHVAWRIVYT